MIRLSVGLRAIRAHRNQGNKQGNAMDLGSCGALDVLCSHAVVLLCVLTWCWLAAASRPESFFSRPCGRARSPPPGLFLSCGCVGNLRLRTAYPVPTMAPRLRRTGARTRQLPACLQVAYPCLEAVSGLRRGRRLRSSRGVFPKRSPEFL